MKTFSLKRLAAVTAIASAGLIAFNASASTIVTLNPSATNGGAGTLSSSNGAFTTDKATTNFASVLTIDSAPGASGTINFTETGFFDLNQFSITDNATSGLHTNYFIYATFTISGTGSWVVPSIFNADLGGLTVTATVWGSPGDQATSGLQYCTPTSGNPTGVCTAGANDFQLGSASLSIPVSANVNLAANNLASEAFDAILSFNPASGTTGVGGFWQSPIPFNVTLNTSATGNAGTPGTTFAVVNGNTVVTTSVTAGPNPIGAGSGNVIFQAVPVPEPGTLALVGLAILAIGAVPLRSRLLGGRAA